MNKKILEILQELQIRIKIMKSIPFSEFEEIKLDTQGSK